MKRRNVPLLLLILMLLLTACVPISSSNQPRYTHDTAVHNTKANGLNLELLGFTWFYQKEFDQIQVVGTARNLTGRYLQACRIIINAYDQDRRFLGRKESFLRPTYLPPDKKAKFDFSLEDGHGVKNLHLEYYFKTQS